MSTDGNPFTQYSEEYKENPFNKFYFYYYTNEKIGGDFNKGRMELDKFEQSQGKGKGIPVRLHTNSWLEEIFYGVGEISYKVTDKKSDMVYVGNLKDNRPDGIGILYRVTDDGNRYPLEKGNFKGGLLNGYGQEWDLVDFQALGSSTKFPAIFREGIYKDNELNGKGIVYNFTEKQSKVEKNLYSPYWRVHMRVDSQETVQADMMPTIIAEFRDLSFTFGHYKDGELVDVIQSF